jgi:hypothetical protein
VTLPSGLNSKDPEQGLQQFVNQSPWDDQVLAKGLRRNNLYNFFVRLGEIV